MKNLLGIVILATVAMTITACGKKGGHGSGGAAAPPVYSAVPACNPTLQNGCSGTVPANTWFGNVAVTDPTKFAKFLADNGLCYGYQCQSTSGFFTLKVQTIRDRYTNSPFAELPGDVNFSIIPRSSYGQSRGIQTRGDGYINTNGNGFQVIYNRTPGYPGYPGSPYFGPMNPATPYGPGIPVNPGMGPNNTLSLKIILQFVDSTQTILNAVLVYENVQFASGTIRARHMAGTGGPYSTGQPSPNGPNGQGPSVLPPYNR